MRCPKCHYISFDAGDRCRNCGYEFSLTVDTKSLDLPIQTGDEPLGPFSDFALDDPDAPASVGTSPEALLPSAKRQTTTGFDLPLFKDRRADDDAPLVTPSAVPRVPLSVRKSAPVARAAHRARAEEPELDLGMPERDQSRPPAMTDSQASADPADAAVPAPLGRRFAAAAIDAVVLGLIDAAILYLTLSLCGLQLFEIGIIPPVPFLSFLVLQNGAYFVAFVAVGGQTVGKMALGIKVVPAGEDRWSDRVPLGTAVLRAAAWVLTVLPAGIGLLPALFSADGRAIHDRLAGTRVVKA